MIRNVLISCAYAIRVAPLSILLLAGCAKSPVSAPNVKILPTYSSISSLILQPDCMTCHTGGNINSFDTYANTMKVVNPGDTSSSPLYTMVSSGQMPLIGNKPSQEEVQATDDWITAGAANN
jgi:hypothetical protein